MIIELQGLQKSFRDKKVLNGASFTAKEGECVGILGGNGCGKSTLLSILAGVQRADCGSFLCDGKDLLKDTAYRNSVLGYVPQEDPLIEELNAWDNLRMWYDKKTLEKQLSEGMLSILGIDGFLKTPVRKMSGGMKKRLSIGCAIAASPKILLLDEPSAALDLICKEKIYTYFEQYKAQGGIILIATHDLQEMSLCDRCYILKHGILEAHEFHGDIHHLVGCLS